LIDSNVFVYHFSRIIARIKCKNERRDFIGVIEKTGGRRLDERDMTSDLRHKEIIRLAGKLALYRATLTSGKFEKNKRILFGKIESEYPEK